MKRQPLALLNGLEGGTVVKSFIISHADVWILIQLFPFLESQHLLTKHMNSFRQNFPLYDETFVFNV
ncbi:CLUMA_CG001302, isoform A [Clunio marinus]|uniref:CLUMA_CG001302, isoform A n=1 Tax=Clunio marinus TaxID=568069 RepID=A0A1J1HHM1_9DIPT|nr:CLUMA_CG001302, isoform A [Clunio marinus]